jgi:hypothetical protein
VRGNRERANRTEEASTPETWSRNGIIWSILPAAGSIALISTPIGMLLGNDSRILSKSGFKNPRRRESTRTTISLSRVSSFFLDLEPARNASDTLAKNGDLSPSIDISSSKFDFILAYDSGE